MQYLWLFVWAFAAISLIGLEFATVSLVSVWFAVGAFAAFIVAIFTDVVWVQLLVFVGVSTLMLILTRPFVKRFLRTKKVETNADSLIGKICTVEVQVGPQAQTGRVKQGDVYWSAFSQNPEDVFVPGEQVVVVSIEGNKLCVSKGKGA